MREAVVDFLENTPNTGATRVVASWVAGKLLEAHPQIEETDLRVPGAKSIRQAKAEHSLFLLLFLVCFPVETY